MESGHFELEAGGIFYDTGHQGKPQVLASDKPSLNYQ